MEYPKYFSQFGSSSDMQQKSRAKSKNKTRQDFNCCQAVGCPLPIIVEAKSSHWIPSGKRNYPQFQKASILPINSPDFTEIFVERPSTTCMQPTSGSHKRNLNSSNHDSLKATSNQNQKHSKSGCDPHHYGLPVTCKAPNSWLQMKWGRQQMKELQRTSKETLDQCGIPGYSKLITLTKVTHQTPYLWAKL